MKNKISRYELGSYHTNRQAWSDYVYNYDDDAPYADRALGRRHFRREHVKLFHEETPAPRFRIRRKRRK